MLKILSIKLTKVGSTMGPFTIYDQFGNIIAENVPKKALMEGVSYAVDVSVTMVKLVSTGDCASEKVHSVYEITNNFEFFNTETIETRTACIWRHIKNPELHNTFYGVIKPYIIEYPFAYSYHDEILQNVKDYTKVYRYIADPYDVSNEASKVELDDEWFNKAVIYNGQQSSGILNLVPKPRHNLKLYNSYPIYRSDSKDITFTKSDNYYQYNTFWSVVKDKTQPLFVRTCEPLSYDKEVNQANMDYTLRSFKKEPIRAKDLRVRHILDDKGDVHLVSQILFTPAQISYK